MSGHAGEARGGEEYPPAATGHAIEIPASLTAKLKPSELRMLEETCALKEHLSRKVIVKIMHAMEGGASFKDAHDTAVKEAGASSSS